MIRFPRGIGVEFLDKGRPQTAYASSEVVLSSGAIGSCQLLMLSGIGPADELRRVDVEPVHDLPGVGKHLQDHINIPISFGTNETIGIGALALPPGCGRGLIGRPSSGSSCRPSIVSGPS